MSDITIDLTDLSFLKKGFGKTYNSKDFYVRTNTSTKYDSNIIEVSD